MGDDLPLNTYNKITQLRAIKPTIYNIKLTIKNMV